MEAGLCEPEFIDGDIDLRINTYRGKNGDNVIKNITKNSNTGTKEDKLLALIQSNPAITQVKLAKKLNVTIRTVKRILSELQAKGIVEREGMNRKGCWSI